MESILPFLLGSVAAGAIVYFVVKPKLEDKASEIRRQNHDRIEKAKIKAQEMMLEAEKKALHMEEKASKRQQSIAGEESEMRQRIEKVEERLSTKEENLEKKQGEVEKKIAEVAEKDANVTKLKEELEKMKGQEVEKLEQVAGMNKDEAKEQLFSLIEEIAQDDIQKKILEEEEKAKGMAGEKAKWIITQAVQKYAAEVTTESTATVVTLPSDDMKGRIIGKEGRNINAFEHLTGVDVIVDDTPNSIIISGFDLLRRYVAKITLERLIEDGRIHPARIEEMLEKVKDETSELIKGLGDKAVLEIGVTGLHPNLVKLIGRLRFRTSYGQNVLKHSLEVGFLSAALASEIGADVEVAKTAGFLHDIGKAVDHEIEGNHALIGKDILEKFGLPERICYAVGAHHEDIPPKSLEDFIVMAADAISSARPGARRENAEAFVKRMKQLEEIANNKEGVKKCYAIQAGREVRVLVEPNKITDTEMMKLSKTIAQEYETNLDYPGQIKVNVIRETRVVEYAK
ncbi:MAG: ribonuclease Y [Candidatus Gracilibacteria bacterium]|nr:ribonuclease Y [Candidatus Gracilibacteria bacterium]